MIMNKLAINFEGKTFYIIVSKFSLEDDEIEWELSKDTIDYDFVEYLFSFCDALYEEIDALIQEKVAEQLEI